MLKEAKASKIVISISNQHNSDEIVDITSPKMNKDSSSPKESGQNTDERNKKDIDLYDQRKPEGLGISDKKEDMHLESEKKKEVIGGHDRKVVECASRSRESSGDKLRSRELSGEQGNIREGRSRNASGDKKCTKSVWSREPHSQSY